MIQLELFEKTLAGSGKLSEVKWIAFFSQTGSEIVELTKQIGRKPDLIVTNNTDESKYKYHPELRGIGTVMSGKHDQLMKYFSNTIYYTPKNTVITLHGYLRIIPEDVCNKYTMYNGHPGAIDLYPELKGKDPQVRTWENKEKYKFIGSVVHKVTPGVDEGDIIKSVYVSNRCYTLDDMYNSLKMTSITAWRFVLKELVCA